jgi:transposase
VADHSEGFVGLDVAKSKNAVAIAEGGRRGEVRYFGEIDNTPEATRRLIARLEKIYKRIKFCYEAGPTGYGLFRRITDLGHDCIVVAPSLIPSRPGDRVKTNRRDAESLAKLLRAGELTAIWVPDARHEAMRDLVRAREAAAQDQTRKRQQVTSFLLRHGRSYPRKKTWGATHARWLTEQVFDQLERRGADYMFLPEGTELDGKGLRRSTCAARRGTRAKTSTCRRGDRRALGVVVASRPCRHHRAVWPAAQR